MEIPVYIFTGLLESGKTTLIHEVAGEEGFLEPGRTILIRCEEGEKGYGEKFLKKHDMILINVRDQAQLTGRFWRKCEKKYAPAQIMIEYNGMWDMDDLMDSGMPEDWFTGGIYSTVNAETAELYITNMRKMFMEPLKYSNLIIFNRCDDGTDRLKFRRNLKAYNPQVQVAFERKDGTMFGNEEEELPFDYSGDTVIIDDMDYGLWYLDAMEHPERYMGKIVEFTAKYCASAKPGEKYFVPGRHIMTCCEEDIQFLGYVCSFSEDPGYEHEDWIRVRVRFDYRDCELYGEEGPVLELVSSEKAEKPDPELVTFT